MLARVKRLSERNLLNSIALILVILKELGLGVTSLVHHPFGSFQAHKVTLHLHPSVVRFGAEPQFSEAYVLVISKRYPESKENAMEFQLSVRVWVVPSPPIQLA